MFLGSQKSLIVPPPFNQGKPASLSSGMGQSIDNILKKINSSLIFILKCLSNLDIIVPKEVGMT
jgi:hypothetical protein